MPALLAGAFGLGARPFRPADDRTALADHAPRHLSRAGERRARSPRPSAQLRVDRPSPSGSRNRASDQALLFAYQGHLWCSPWDAAALVSVPRLWKYLAKSTGGRILRKGLLTIYAPKRSIWVFQQRRRPPRQARNHRPAGRRPPPPC